MPRPRQSGHELPARVYRKHGAFYFVEALTNKWINLGRDYAQAMLKWAQLVQVPTKVQTVNELLDRYFIEVVPGKAPRTQSDNAKEARFIRAVFGKMPIDCVTASHIRQYRDSRQAPTRANREIALLAHAFSKAVEWDLLKVNPAHGRNIKAKEKSRDRYVTDEELHQFKQVCPLWVRCYVDLKYATSLRKGDMLNLRWSDVREEGLMSHISKTGGRVLYEWTPELLATIEQLRTVSKGDWLFSTEAGTQYTTSGFDSIWQRLCVKFAAQGGTRFREHDLRGKTATDADEQGEDAQKLLSHKSRAMTEAYIKTRQIQKLKPHRRSK